MTEDHLKQLGRINVNFSVLEIHLLLLTWGLISEKQAIGKAITSGMTFNSISNIFSSLCKVVIDNPVVLREFEETIIRVNEINVRRNQIIHSYWITEVESKNISRLKFKADGFKGLKQTVESISAEDIKKIADDIGAMVKELMDLGLKYKY